MPQALKRLYKNSHWVATVEQIVQEAAPEGRNILAQRFRGRYKTLIATCAVEQSMPGSARCSREAATWC